MDSIVCFKLAKQLKKHGFDKYCYYYYDKDGNIQESYLENGSSSDTYFRVESSDLPDNFNSNKGEYSAPTIAQVVMWIYEIRGIWIEASLNSDDRKFTSMVNCLPINSSCVTPTEAYIDAIIYLLNF